MDRHKLKEILAALARGDLTAGEVYSQLSNLPYQEMGFARLDTHRSIRQGIPEVIFSPGKTAEQIVKIAQELHRQHKVVVATRLMPEAASQVLPFLKARYEPEARMLILGSPKEPHPDSHFISVVAAGTADLPVAEEAALMIESSGVLAKRLYDVGVAGLHRLLANLDELRAASVVIAVAGMDGALPSVIGGLLAGPIIAVPTSVGYGTGLDGIAALLTMLNSCAAGLSVVNIDNGFGAAIAGLRILYHWQEHSAKDGDVAIAFAHRPRQESVDL